MMTFMIYHNPSKEGRQKINQEHNRGAKQYKEASLILAAAFL
jgi:hypothetical protein